MKKEKLKKMPTAELIYKKKMVMIAIYLSMLALLLFFVTILWAFKNGELKMTEFITPSMVLICLLISFNMIKNIREELSSRNIDK